MSVKSPENLLKTACYDLHIEANGRMVPFAGYEMPVQYQGIKAEHLHCREFAGLFDVSHMGQVLVSGSDSVKELEQLMPVDLGSLELNQGCLTFLTNEQGGILDDLIITRRSETDFFIVFNGACKHGDIEHCRKYLKTSTLVYFEEQALLALQGPKAQEVLIGFLPNIVSEISSLKFKQGINIQLDIEKNNEKCECEIYLTRSGYTGEDGFEVSVPNEYVKEIARGLLENKNLQWIGLGARDSLRLEAGMCLYGHDLDEKTTPVEAGFTWSIDKSRRAGGEKEGGFLGADIILRQIEGGSSSVKRKRVGFVVEGKMPVREGAEIVNQENKTVGVVTSGGFSPSLGHPILMGYIETDSLAIDMEKQLPLYAVVRGKQVPILRKKMPFVPHKYVR